MKTLILGLILVSGVANASDCGRALGTPGFVARDAVKAVAQAAVLGECEGYQQSSGAAGTCTAMGCSVEKGVFACTAMIVVCTE